jgi:hypothetical protein
MGGQGKGRWGEGKYLKQTGRDVVEGQDAPVRSPHETGQL